MLTGSMETVPSSYEDSGIFLDQAEDFGFTGEEDLDDEEFERVEGDDDILQPRTISRHGSIDGDENSQNQDDELASTGILILGPSQMPATLRARPAFSTLNHPPLSPRLSLPDSESLPTDLHSIHLESIQTSSVHSSTSSVMVGDTYEEQKRLRRNQAVQMTYFVLGSLFMVVLLCIFVCTTVSLLAERRSWVQSNQKLEDQMKRMQADWVNLATKYEMDQEASIATSRTIKATLQAQMEEQRKIIEDLYQEQRDLKEKKERERAERERRIQEEKAKQRFQRQEQARARKMMPPSSKTTNSFTNKKSFGNDSGKAKTFDIYWTDTEEAILKWSDETHDKLRSMLNSLGKKVWKAQETFLTRADRTLQHVRTKLVKAWSDFYAAELQPK